MSVLALVMVLALLASIGVISHHLLWRGASRNLHALHETRELANLATSALEEAAYVIQRSCDQDGPWAVWLLTGGPAETRPVPVTLVRDLVPIMSPPGGQLEYAVVDVSASRLAPVLPAARSGAAPPGIVDLVARVSVTRSFPGHRAVLLVTQRRLARMAADLGPFASAGRHVELFDSPVASWEVGE